MSSIISGPIFSSFGFNSNSNSLNFPQSDCSCSNYAYQMNNSKLGHSLYNLDLLQWQNQPPSGLSNSMNLLSSRSQKNHIRENIRNLRRLEQQRKQQQQENMSIPLTDRSFRSNQANRHLPPRPLTSASNQLVHSKSLQNWKSETTNAASATTTATTTPYGDAKICKSKTSESFRSRKNEKYVQTWTNQHPNQDDSPRTHANVSDQAVQTQTLATKPPTPNKSRPVKTRTKDLHINVSKSIQTGDFEHSAQRTAQDLRSTNMSGKENRTTLGKSVQTSQPTPAKLIWPKNNPSVDQLPKHDYLRAHARDAVADSELKLLSAVPIQPLVCHPDPSKMTVPRARSAKNVQLIRRNINFVRANAHLASTSPARLTSSIRRASSMGSLIGGSRKPIESTDQSECCPDFHTKPNPNQGGMWPERKLPCGVLPQYLIKRQQKVKEVQAKSDLNKPDPDQPPGHQRMPEQERLDTLELLKKAHTELLDEMFRLPIRSDTLRVRSRRAEIETRLAELEQAIGIFSKPKVFIKPD